MKTSKAEDMVCQLVADASSVQTLAAELCETFERNSPDADKANAIYTIAKSQEKMLEELAEALVELRD